jgi:hypothetical protein
MTKTLSALVAAATLATATFAVPPVADARCVGCAVGAGERPADAQFPATSNFPASSPTAALPQEARTSDWCKRCRSAVYRSPPDCRSALGCRKSRPDAG